MRMFTPGVDLMLVVPVAVPCSICVQLPPMSGAVYQVWTVLPPLLTSRVTRIAMRPSGIVAAVV